MTTLTPKPDAGERQLFETVFEAYGAEIYRYLRRQTRTPEDAADLHQETFLRAFRAYGRLTQEANVRAWLYRIAGNLATDLHRRRRSPGGIGQPLDADEERERPANGAGPEQIAQAGELRAAVRTALMTLSPHQRVAVSLRVLDDRAYDEVAAALGCTEVSARQHVSQGLRRLRTALEGWR